MTSQGPPATRFKRAIERRSLINAELAAREMGRLSVERAACSIPGLPRVEVGSRPGFRIACALLPWSTRSYGSDHHKWEEPMFAITSTRIVGLIAVVCAVVVAPQALAVPSTDSNTAAPMVVPPEAAIGYDLSGFDLKAGFHSKAALPRAAHPSPRLLSVEAFLLPLAASPQGGLFFPLPKAATKATAIEALQRRSVDLDAAYRKLYPGAYRPAVQKSDTPAVWSFPCSATARRRPSTTRDAKGDPRRRTATRYRGGCRFRAIRRRSQGHT